MGRLRRRHWLGLSLGLAALLLPGLTACQRPAAPPTGPGHRAGGPSQPPLRATLFIAVGLSQTTQVTAEQQATMQRSLRQLEHSFREIHPGVQLEVMVFSERQLTEEVERRNRSGLGPDLIMLNGQKALELKQLGLIRTLPHPHQLSRNLRPELLPAVEVAGSPTQLLALPLGLQPQLACYDRRRMGSPPETLQQLLEASSNGQRFGISLRLVNLAWTIGSVGSLPSIVAIRRGSPITAEHRQAIERWLLWLRQAAMQQHINLESNSSELVQQLNQGQLDWITCRSQDVSQLRARLGGSLGLARMPDGDGHAASPLSTLLVWGLGRNSSEQQRRAAEELVKFTLNRPIQRAFTLHTQGMLPVTRNTPLPLRSSANLAALLGAQEQADQASDLSEALVTLRDRETALDQILKEFHYGHLTREETSAALIRALQPSQR